MRPPTSYLAEGMTCSGTDLLPDVPTRFLVHSALHNTGKMARYALNTLIVALAALFFITLLGYPGTDGVGHAVFPILSPF